MPASDETRHLIVKIWGTNAMPRNRTLEEAQRPLKGPNAGVIGVLKCLKLGHRLPWYCLDILHLCIYFGCLIVFDGTLMVVSCKYMQMLLTSHHTKEAKASQNRKSSHCLILLVIFDPRAQVAPEHCGFLGWCREACYCYSGMQIHHM